jgi:hypothetical protein
MLKSNTFNIWNNKPVTTGIGPKPIQSNLCFQNAYTDIPLSFPYSELAGDSTSPLSSMLMGLKQSERDHLSSPSDEANN